MPTYEYVCDACGHEFEEVQKITDPAIERCPKCKKRKVRRLISQGNFILKGSGWYVTDYKGGGKRPAKDRDAAAAERSSSNGDGKSDTKSDGKPETKLDAKPDAKPDAKDDKPAKKVADKEG